MVLANLIGKFWIFTNSIADLLSSRIQSLLSTFFASRINFSISPKVPDHPHGSTCNFPISLTHRTARVSRSLRFRVRQLLSHPRAGGHRFFNVPGGSIANFSSCSRIIRNGVDRGLEGKKEDRPRLNSFNEPGFLERDASDY